LENLSRIVKEFVLIEGACEAGIATLKTLEGGPPSSNLTYVLPEAKSAITYAVPIDQKPIAPYLMKKERLALEKAFVQANVLASGIALHLANYLTQKGYPSVPVAANNVFRPPDPGTPSDYIVDLYYTEDVILSVAAIPDSIRRGNGLHGLPVGLLFPKMMMNFALLMNECKVPIASGLHLKAVGIFILWMKNCVCPAPTVSWYVARIKRNVKRVIKC